MKNKDGDGKIELSFLQKANHLLVTVTDNGPGIEPIVQAYEEKEHKSVGMSLTQRRLDLLEGYGDSARLRHENVKGTEGEVIGSRVMVEIPVE
jgi:sensor histidine kinase YesM